MKKIVQEIIREHLGQKAQEISQITDRGQVNEIYVVATESSKYIVRIDLSESTTDRFKKEAWFINETKKLGILGPTIFGVGRKAEHPYMIMLYVEGKNGDEATENEKDKIWNELGKYARKIHSIPVEGYGEGMTAPGVFKDSWLRYINYNISSLTPDDKIIELGVITEKESKKIKNIFLELLNTNFNFGLIHHDLSLKNTILTTTGEVCLIDWGSAQSAPVPHLDIVEILDSSLDENSKQFALFLEGYGLKFQEYEKIKTEMAKINLLINMDKLRWALDRRQDKIDYFSQEVKNKLAKIL